MGKKLKPIFQTKDVIKGIAAGIGSAAATHPIEMAQIGTADLPKMIQVRDANGKVIGMQKNPARYGKIKVPFTNKEIEFDKGDSFQHFLARVPKGIAGWGAGTMVGSMALRMATKGKVKGKFFK